MTRVVVACGADDRFALPLAVTLYSAAANLRPGEGMDVHVLDGGLTGPNRDRIARVVAGAGADARVRFLTPRSDVLASAGLPTGPYNLMTYLRLLLPEMLPPDVPHVLYLDSDLTVRESLAGIWAERSDAHAIAGVPDYSNPTVSGSAGPPNWRELGLPPDAPYVNAGVLLMNLAAWRAEGYGRKVIEYCRATRAINRFADQDGINALLCRECKTLDPRWNVPAYIEFERIFGAVDDSPIKARVKADPAAWMAAARIVHFIGGRKPWGRGLGCRSQWEWLGYCRRSGWFRDDRWGYARLVGPLWADAAARRAYRAARKLTGRA